MVFFKEVVKGICTWKWGSRSTEIPRVVSYCYLGIEFANNGSWDRHVQKIMNLSNRSLSTVARRLLLVSVLHPILEYGSEVWACNKRQAASLESIQLNPWLLF